MDPALPGRLAGYLGLFALVGAPAGRALIRRATKVDLAHEVERRARAIVLAGAALWIIACLWRLGCQAAALTDDGSPAGLDVYRAALSSGWGGRWRWQFVAGAAALVAGARFKRSPASTALVGLIVAATLPLTGHALEYGGGALVGWLLQTVHVIAAALWLGTLGALVMLLPAHMRRMSAERRRPALLRIAAGFSRLALAGSCTAILAGSLLAIADVGSWGALAHSDYGRVLLLKLAALAAALAFGAWNWRRGVPRLRDAASADAERRLATTAGLELGLALVVLILTAIVSATEAPGIRRG